MVLYINKNRNVERIDPSDDPLFHQTDQQNRYPYFDSILTDDSVDALLKTSLPVKKRQPLLKQSNQYEPNSFMSPKETKIRQLTSRKEIKDKSLFYSDSSESSDDSKVIGLRLPLARQKSDTLLLESDDNPASQVVEIPGDDSFEFKRSRDSEKLYENYIAMLNSIGTVPDSSVYSSTMPSTSSTTLFPSSCSESSFVSTEPSLVKLNSLRFSSRSMKQGTILGNDPEQNSALMKSIASLQTGPSLFVDTSTSLNKDRTRSFADTTLSETHLKDESLSMTNLKGKIQSETRLKDTTCTIPIGKQYSNSEADAIRNNEDKYDIDMKHNNEAFDIVASMMVERLESKALTSTEIGTLAPISVRRNFVEALQFRETLLPQHIDEREPIITELTRKCIHLGLSRKEEENILLTADGREKEVRMIFFNDSLHLLRDSLLT